VHKYGGAAGDGCCSINDGVVLSSTSSSVDCWRPTTFGETAAAMTRPGAHGPTTAISQLHRMVPDASPPAGDNRQDAVFVSFYNTIQYLFI